MPKQACEHLSPLRVPEIYVLVFLFRHIYHTDDEKPATRNMREKTVIEKTGFLFCIPFSCFCTSTRHTGASLYATKGEDRVKLVST